MPVIRQHIFREFRDVTSGTADDQGNKWSILYSASSGMSIVSRATKRPRGDAHGYHHASHYNCSHCSARRRRLVRPGTLVLSNGKVPRRSERSSSSYDRTRETRPAGMSAWSASVTSKSLVTSRPIVHQSRLVNHRSFSSLPYPRSMVVGLRKQTL